MWIMERLFKYTNFGIVSLIHQDFFISSVSKFSAYLRKLILIGFSNFNRSFPLTPLQFNWFTSICYHFHRIYHYEPFAFHRHQGRDNREQSIKSLKDHINQSFIPRMRNWMVLFPEGGFLHKRKAISKRYAAKNNLPDLEYVSLPRVGALKAIFSVLAPHSQPEVIVSNNNSNVEKSTLPALTNGSVQEITADGEYWTISVLDKWSLCDLVADKQAIASDHLDYILDITIGYPQGKPLDLPCIVHGMRDPFKTHFLYRLYHTSQVRLYLALKNWFKSWYLYF